MGHHRRPLGMPHAESQPAGEGGHAVRALLHALGGLLPRARHDALRRFPLAQRRLQPDPLLALRPPRYERGRGALLAAAARRRLPPRLRGQVARQLRAHAARFRLPRRGRHLRLQSRAAQEARPQPGPRAARQGPNEAHRHAGNELAGYRAVRHVGPHGGAGRGHHAALLHGPRHRHDEPLRARQPAVAPRGALGGAARRLHAAQEVPGPLRPARHQGAQELPRHLRGQARAAPARIGNAGAR